MATISTRGPLDGIHILDLSTTFMGPYATAVLARMGADVIKVEAPTGDIVRGIGPSRSSQMGHPYIQGNTGKRSLVLDLKKSEAQSALHRLVRRADVFVHNLRPEPSRRLGIDADNVLKTNPECIHATFCGFGPGPYEDHPAYDDVIQGLSGLASVQGRGGDPQYVVTTMVDKTVALAGAAAILGALIRRMHTGSGESVLIPMYEFMVDYLLLENQGGWLFDPPIGEPGYARTASAYRRPFKTLDGFISVLIYTDGHWRRFFEMTGHADLASDIRFHDIRGRTENIDELYSVVEAALSGDTTASWLTKLSAASIPAEPVNTITDLFKDEHLLATGFFQRTQHPTEGALIQGRFPIQFGGGLGGVRHAPLLGEDTIGVLREAEFSTDEIEDLVNMGAVVQHGDSPSKR